MKDIRNDGWKGVVPPVMDTHVDLDSFEAKGTHSPIH